MLLVLTTKLPRLALPLFAFLAWAPAAHAWSWPVQGPVLAPFSYDEAHPYAAGQHRGIDIGAAAAGETVVAPASGTVSFAGSVPTSGRSVTIETADGYAVTLTHLGSVAVARGATVTERDAVGTIGPSGTPEEDGPYVHLGIRIAADTNGYVDPLGLLPPDPDGGATAGAPSASQPSSTGTASGASGGAPSTSAQPSPVPASEPTAPVRAASGARVPPRVSGRERGRAGERPSERQPVRSPRRPVVQAGHTAKPRTHREVPVSKPRAGERAHRSQPPVVETAAPAEPTGLGAGHELTSSGPLERISPSPRPVPARLLPVILDGGAALVALAAALAAARSRRRSDTTSVPAAQVVHLPRPVAERRSVSRAA
jgi:Peptidase family M23